MPFANMGGVIILLLQYFADGYLSCRHTQRVYRGQCCSQIHINQYRWRTRIEFFHPVKNSHAGFIYRRIFNTKACGVTPG